MSELKKPDWHALFQIASAQSGYKPVVVCGYSATATARAIATPRCSGTSPVRRAGRRVTA
jgi:hypothetical protein